MNLVITFIVAVVAELAVAVVVVVVEIKLLHIAMNCSESPNFCCTRVSTLLQPMRWNLINGSSTNVWGCPVVLVLKISNYVLSVILKVLFIFPWVPSPPSIFHRSFARPSTHLTLSALSQVCVCEMHVMQRGFQAASCTTSQNPTSIPCSVRSLRTMSARSFSWRRLRIPWGGKKKSTESKLPEVSAKIYCAIP